MESFGDSLGISAGESAPLLPSKPNGSLRYQSQTFRKAPPGAGEGFFQLLKPQVRKSAGIQQVRQAKASTDREVLSAG